MRFLPELLTRNGTLKLAALGIAILLWTAVRVEAPNRQPLPGVPIRVELSDPEYALAADPSPPAVELRVGGPARALFQLALNPPSLVVPVEDVQVADTTIALRRDWVRLQDHPGVVVEDVSPPTVRLTFERLATGAVPLVIPSTGGLSDGMALAAPLSANPPVVRVSGPRTLVAELDSLVLVPMDLTDLDRPGTHRIEQAVDTTGLSGLSVSPARVTVSVRIEEVKERTVDSVPVVLESGADLEVEPPVMEVHLRGARSLLTWGDSIPFTLTVPEEALKGLETARLVEVRIRGLSDLVQAVLSSDSVLVRRRSSS